MKQKHVPERDFRKEMKIECSFVIFVQISSIALVFPLLTLNK